MRNFPLRSWRSFAAIVAMHGDVVLQVKGLSKSFPGVKALDGVQLQLERGKVHALLGENGAGKSTLMNILIGLQTPDAGEIRLKGRPVRIKSPHQALQLGLAMIHQELMPFPELSVAENIFMGQQPASKWLGWMDYKALHRKTEQLLQRLGIELSPTRKLKELSVAQIQMVEIAKALAHQAEVIIMDEPTSALSAQEVERLFAIIGDLKQQGVAIIFISHKLEEVFRIADAVTVFRDGRYVSTHSIQEVDADKLIALMVGRELGPSAKKRSSTPGEVILGVRNLSRAGKFQSVSFDLRRGEVLGIAGLMGAGRTELVNAIYGLAPAHAGEIWVHGKKVRIRHPRTALAHAIALVSEDRKEHGLVLPMSVKHNLTLSNLAQYSRGGFIKPGTENRLADEQVQRFGIKSAGRNHPVNYLSGGNQQKVVLAKALLRAPDILLLDEPTRGIDIGAKQEIYRLITDLALAGHAILLVSSELPELLSLSDRILVMRAGRITAELHPAKTNQAEIMKYAMPEWQA